MSDDEIHAMVKQCGLDWQRGYMPLFDGDDTNRYAVLVRAVLAAQPKPAPVRLDEFVYLLLKRVYYPVATELVVADGAQLVNGQWWMPRWGCDTFQHAIDEHGDEQPKPAPVLLTIDEMWDAYRVGGFLDVQAAVLKKNGWGES